MRSLLQICLGGLLAAGPFPAEAATWPSPATGRELPLEFLAPAAAAASRPVPAVIYLVNLAAPRAGTESDEAIIRDLRAEGLLVAVLDYAHDPRAVLPGLVRDLAALRQQIYRRTFFPGRAVDRDHVYIVPSGHRLRRDVVYGRDPGRTLAMDIIYPARPAQPAGAVLEFSCDNANRMGSYSLDFCTDTLVPAAALAGFAAVMADHPVAPPYEGIDAMPDCARRIKAAVRTLRAEGAVLGLNGRIVPAGFSRGSGMALLLATTQGRPEFEGYGEHPGADSSVQGAVVMSGRFTYLDLRPDDEMIKRYNRVWGRRATHEEVWRAHGALDYLSQPTVPLFLTINAGESPDALHQMAVLRRQLTARGSPFTYQAEEGMRGHKMPLAPGVIGPLLGYLRQRLLVAQP